MRALLVGQEDKRIQQKTIPALNAAGIEVGAIWTIQHGNHRLHYTNLPKRTDVVISLVHGLSHSVADKVRALALKNHVPIVDLPFQEAKWPETFRRAGVVFGASAALTEAPKEPETPVTPAPELAQATPPSDTAEQGVDVSQAIAPKEEHPMESHPAEELQPLHIHEGEKRGSVEDGVTAIDLIINEIEEAESDIQAMQTLVDNTVNDINMRLDRLRTIVQGLGELGKLHIAYASKRTK